MSKSQKCSKDIAAAQSQAGHAATRIYRYVKGTQREKAVNTLNGGCRRPNTKKSAEKLSNIW